MSSCAGVSIRQAITLDPCLPGLALEAANSGAAFIGFYFDVFGDEPNDGEWSYWTSETADASATNCYYTPGEIRSLLLKHGFDA